ncbi:MFS transporter [Actinomadura gamaensis]|uniref:MFS transporter n=1 Tax=Actinomadura gamaensis TaxID=1763541 RepID=A0ABV9TXR5_9ACTN
MGALHDGRFRRLLVGQSLSSLGDSALYLALGIWAKDLTGSNAAAGAVFLCLALPVPFGPLAGHVVDRTGRRRLLIVTNAVAGTGVLALLLVRSTAQLPIIYVVAVGYGCAFGLLRPALAGLVKDLVRGEDLVTANAAIRTVGEGFRVLSPLVGAGLYTAAGGGALAVFDSATFGVAILVLATLRVEESEVPDGPSGGAIDGVRHIRRTPLLAWMSLVAAAAFGVLGFFDSTDFAVVDQGLRHPPSFFGVLMSVQGAGSVLGGLTVARMIRRVGEARTVGAALALCAAGSGLMTVPLTPVVLGGFVLAGVGVPWLLVGYATAWQRHTPPRLIGRVSAAADLYLLLPQTASIAAGAALVGVLDYRVLLAACGATLAVTGGLLLVRRVAAPDAVSPEATPARN